MSLYEKEIKNLEDYKNNACSDVKELLNGGDILWNDGYDKYRETSTNYLTLGQLKCIIEKQEKIIVMLSKLI